MNNIPVHKTSERFRGQVALMRSISESKKMPSDMFAHRDDYYIFLLIREGSGKALIDFTEYEIKENSIITILPGQVHSSGDNASMSGWFLAADSMLVKEEYKEILERVAIYGNITETDVDRIKDLNDCAGVIFKRLKSDNGSLEQHVVHDLLSSYIGMFAEIYCGKFSESIGKRASIIIQDFRSILAANYHKMKKPSEYAAVMHISPSYLYEVIKKMTGQSIGHYIRNEIIVQAKRLLFYTNKSIKEIALELGYDDWAYFTRLFTKMSKMTPTQFRRKYLK